jgi:short-subunit dehydrogenase
MEVSNKIIVVTGAGSGIGRALSLNLLRKQAKVVGVDINLNSLLETQKIAGVSDDKFKAFALDITDKEKVESMPNEVITHFGSVDGIINNAGIIQHFIPIKDLTYEEINRVFNVNFFGTVYMTKAFLPYLIDRSEAYIVNISSMGGFLPVPGQSIYGSAKAAVKLFTEGLYAELKETNVKVTVVFPGAIATNITENSGLGKPKKVSSDSKIKPLAPEKAAQIIIEGMEKNKFRIVVGNDAKFLDFLYRFSPKFATNFVQKKMAELRKS